MKRDYKLFIKDILDAINSIESFAGDMEYDEFFGDDKTRSAVVWQIQIIGEATKNIPLKIKTLYKELPWKDMAAMRDKISHFYFGVDYKIVWKVIKKDLPLLKPLVERIVRELDQEKTTKNE